MKDLIFSRNSENTSLSMAQIFNRAPAVFSETQSESLTDRYSQITTADAIDILRDYGYKPVQAAQVNPTKADQNHVLHYLAFAQPDDDPSTREQGRPEIILYNSHDGKNTLRLYAGFFRWVCSNSLAAGEGFEIKARHSKATAANFETMIQETAGKLPTLQHQIESLRNSQPTASRIQDFAQAAARLRWSDADSSLEAALWSPEPMKPGSYSTDETVTDLMGNNCAGYDRGSDGWRIFNRVQEKLMRGGAQVLSLTKKNPRGIHRTARGLTNVDAALRLNRGLWDLAQEHLTDTHRRIKLRAFA